MYQPRGCLFIVIAAFVGFAASWGYAKRAGADRGFSGGFAANGNSCLSCHPFNHDHGTVEVFGLPIRYRAGEVYDVGVRVTDPEQRGAGFEVSTETPVGHAGSLLVADAVRTRFASIAMEYLTHTSTGVNDSVAAWDAAGGSYTYSFQWQAPDTDVGDVTLFAAANALGVPGGFGNVRYYAAYGRSHFAIPGDGDGDGDLDLFDFAAVQRCFDEPTSTGAADCAFVDTDGDGAVGDIDVADFVAALDGATSALPAAYVLADAVRGGKLYDRWWVVNGAPAPVGDHPLYPAVGQQAGASTFRCKECHGWDYKGAGGAYGSGVHFTGIAGVNGTTLSPQRLFDLLRADPADLPGGHNMLAVGMTEVDLWDVVKMTLEKVIDTDDYIDATGVFVGSSFLGGLSFDAVCSNCHGPDGTALNFGTIADPEFVGTVASANPWELLHKVRFAHPGSPMPSYELLERSISSVANIGAHAATLPQ